MTLDECFELGFIVKPHALKGQMTAQLDVDNAATYDKLKTVYLALATAPTKLTAYQVERVNPQVGQRVLLKLRGIERIEEAEPLRGAKLWLPLSELPELQEHQFYFHDVIGFQVIDEKEGALGVVENFYELPQQDVLAMRYKGQEVLLPVVDELVSHADMEAKQLFVNMPEGLLDIYLNPGAHKNPNAD
ncbi:16S rRNA processing protein RimM [Hymenobacter sp. UV11]|uniref:ribosome maturation factor RimM n=1 Tax=Hymenobacter sp. UV11 TaxID=1849735 RepID=UPI00106213F0|nr:ribosome maturation factor RimM [Hymenobacter sp. UV11]TDN40506.1 16S rRNA processing protein RimM [Hymenobacter sp. UV11]TFZ66479.1 16S rRNA processing protein RimM [Hymenobacter sp. UV11]